MADGVLESVFYFGNLGGGLNVIQFSYSEHLMHLRCQVHYKRSEVLDSLLIRKVHWIPLNFNGSRKRWMLLLCFPLGGCYVQIIKEKSIWRPNAHLFLRLYHAADV